MGEHGDDLVVVLRRRHQLVEQHHGATRQRERIGSDRRALAELEDVGAAGQRRQRLEACGELGPARLGERRWSEGDAIERRERLSAHLLLDRRRHPRRDDAGQGRHAEGDAAPEQRHQHHRGNQGRRPADFQLVDPALDPGRSVCRHLGQLERRFHQAARAAREVQPPRQIAQPGLEPHAIDRHHDLDGLAAHVDHPRLDADPHRMRLRRAAVVVGAGAGRLRPLVWRSVAAHRPKSRSIASLSSAPAAEVSPAAASASDSSGPPGRRVSESAR